VTSPVQFSDCIQPWPTERFIIITTSWSTGQKSFTTDSYVDNQERFRGGALGWSNDPRSIQFTKFNE